MGEDVDDNNVASRKAVCIITNPTPMIDSPVDPGEVKQRLLIERRVYPDRKATVMEVADLTTGTATEMEISRDGIAELIEVLENLLMEVDRDELDEIIAWIRS